MAGPRSVEDYLAEVPEEARVALEEVRRAIKAAAPDTVETISYRMPTFKYQGRALVGIAAFKSHCSLFPYSESVLETLEEELRPFDTSGKGTIRFPVAKPLPAAVIKRIVKVRMKEIEARS